MVPTIVECDLCGAASAVISWQPIFDDARNVTTQGNQPTEVSCKIDCPYCGNRIQVLRLEVTDEPDTV